VQGDRKALLDSPEAKYPHSSFSQSLNPKVQGDRKALLDSAEAKYFHVFIPQPLKGESQSHHE